ncbi:MAG: RNA polymerase-associated protein RapA [Thiotrichales bacterium]
MTNEYIPGQRWVSEADLQLGLGMISIVTERTVDVLFPASGELRTYARRSAPLSRIAFAPGDEITSADGWKMTVDSAEEMDGIVVYIGTRDDGAPAILEETRLSGEIQLNRPADRLFNGQLDHPKWFRLRAETLRHARELAASDLRGLTGGRTSLIPHQLYVAHEVAGRYAPRVLLADEVGLGKTIEAGMILHSQWLRERARRVLIVVPETLQHQWLVEMLRRFNLQFSLFDTTRCEALLAESPENNPFEAEQRVLCTPQLLAENPDYLQYAAAAGWDLLIVDEAHHLEWSETEASPEYQCIEVLAATTPGVLLLTATPEQLGRAGHFARLRLLDPDRFPSLDAFLAEETSYEPVARAVEALLSHGPMSSEIIELLEETIKEGDNLEHLETLKSPQTEASRLAHARAQLIEHLLDRHGTGRVLFRNTRAAVQGFPQRQFHQYSLPLPEAYADCLEDAQLDPGIDVQSLICLEQCYEQWPDQQENWLEIDPRVNWLSDQLKALAPAKVLVIAARTETALDLADALRIKRGIHAAVFHEGMSIIERDRAAAYFADQEDGTQVLLCSEIGSEGRNFQFAHHLILFDLPLNPDLLEQRIGRLDRIGQRSETIDIHVPCLEGSPQALLARWYHEGLQAFEQTCPAGHAVFKAVEPQLLSALRGAIDADELMTETCERHRSLSEALQQGRDRLLEYNSSRPATAAALQEAAEQADMESDILDYLDQLFDCFGVEFEDNTATSFIIRPGPQLHSDYFPGLHEEGMTITLDRATALSNEDMHYLTWEHPMVVSAMEMVRSGELGNTAFTAIKTPNAKPGQILLECLFVLDCAALQASSMKRYLPPTSLRLVLDQKGNEYSAKLSAERIDQLQEKVTGKMAREIIKACHADLKAMIAMAEEQADLKAEALIEAARAGAVSKVTTEIERLQALKQINDNVRDQELQHYESERDIILGAFETASLQLDAVRVLVTA